MSDDDQKEPMSQTELAATLPREDLALMATACQELSWWERRMMLPMLSSDMPALRRWLLAKVDELGMEPEARLRRAAARSSRWRAMARGEDCPDERFSVPKHSSLFASRNECDRSKCRPAWSAGVPQSAWSLARMAAFFSHWGIATGPRADYPYADKDGPVVFQLLGAVAWAVVLTLAARRHSDDMAAKVSGVQSVFFWGAAVFFGMRSWLWLAVGPTGRVVFKAQAAQPIWMWGWRQACGAWESLSAGRTALAKGPASFEGLSAAIQRASLGQPPTSEELEAARKVLAERERRAASVKAASEPERSLAAREAVDFSRVVTRAQVVKAAKLGRL